MLNLYRRYRPLKLEDVVGQEQVTNALAAALKQGKISHAYLFIGPRGCGKTSVARILAHTVNSFEYKIEDDYVDIIEIDGASNRGIENIRELREKVLIAPTQGKYKVYIIDEVHMLTKEAFNALLKTLEEPPEHVIFIMATTDAYKVPVTITSRAQTYTFRLADSKTMLEYLREVCTKEKIKIDDAALEIIAKKGGGSFRDSLSLLDQVSTLSEQGITKELLISAMGLPEDEKLAELLEKYSSGDINLIAETLKNLLSSGVKPEVLAEKMIEMILERPRAEFLPLLSKLPEVKEPFAEAKLLVALATNVKAGAQEVVSEKKAEQDIKKVTQSSTAKTPEPSNRDPEPIQKAESIKKPSEGKKPESAPKPEKAPEVVSSINSNFDWNEFKERVREKNNAISAQLERCEYEIAGTVLKIFPRTSFHEKILSGENNKNILITEAAGLKVEIRGVGEHPVSAKKDAMITKISAIMGGEVLNDNGGYDPF